MAVGQSVCLWGGMVGGRCRFPWAMPKATLTMAFGQFVCWVCGVVPSAMLEVRLTMAVGQSVGLWDGMVVG